MAHIFISYSKKNQPDARRLAAYFVEHGFDVWIDDRIDYGSDWEEEIQQAINECAALVVIMTPESEDSKWVRTECEYAQQKDKPVFPVLLAGDVFFRFVSVQYVDLRDGAMPPEAFLNELAEHAPRKSGTGEDITGSRLKAVTVQPAAPPQVALSQADMESETVPPPQVTPPLQATLPPEPAPETSAAAVADAPAGGGGAGDLETVGQASSPAVTPSLAQGSAPFPEPRNIVPARRSSLVLVAAGLVVGVALLYGVFSRVPAESSGQAAGTPAATNADSTQAQSQPVAAITPVMTNAAWTVTISTMQGADMALVPPGCFTMGSEQGDSDEQPTSEQCFETPFWIGVTEVTNQEYRGCVDAGACQPPQDAAPFDDDALSQHPVVNVTWEQASQYAYWLGGRLPTEAEWEYAARGPDMPDYPWGNEFLANELNFCDVNCSAEWADTTVDDGYAETAPAGTYADNVSWVGAVDMSGNVREWTWSLYWEYPYVESDGRNDGVEIEDGVVSRGGSWYSVDTHNRTSKRFNSDPNGFTNELGFRILLPYGDA